MYQMMSPMGSGMMLFWLILSVLFILLLVAAVIWLVRTLWKGQRNAHIQRISQPQDTEPSYERGYQAEQYEVPARRGEEQGGQAEYEQPSLEYPQEMRF